MSEPAADAPAPNELVALRGAEKRDHIRSLFDKLAPQYDRLNLVISVGQTTIWRKRALRDLRLEPGQRLLDIGTGTGWVVQYLAKRFPEATLEGSDLAPQMLVEARRIDPDHRYFEADVCDLPCETATYDVVTTVFTSRNFPQLEQSVAEMMRVLKPGGKLMVLDSFPPKEGSLWGAFQSFWMGRVVPVLVRPFADPQSYRYLAQSIANHVTQHELAALCRENGATDVDVRDYSFGSATRVLATKARALPEASR